MVGYAGYSALYTSAVGMYLLCLPKKNVLYDFKWKQLFSILASHI